jgi:hypothetical protein
MSLDGPESPRCPITNVLPVPKDSNITTIDKTIIYYNFSPNVSKVYNVNLIGTRLLALIKRRK